MACRLFGFMGQPSSLECRIVVQSSSYSFQKDWLPRCGQLYLAFKASNRPTSSLLSSVAPKLTYWSIYPCRDIVSEACVMSFGRFGCKDSIHLPLTAMACPKPGLADKPAIWGWFVDSGNSHQNGGHTIPTHEKVKHPVHHHQPPVGATTTFCHLWKSIGPWILLF